MAADESFEPEVTPAGEEIHLPNPSLLPILNAVGISLAIVGVTISLLLVVLGATLFVVTAGVWIRDARREMEDLPLEHGH